MKQANEGTLTQEANLKNHQEILGNLFAELDNAAQAGYEEQAVQENLKFKAPPGADHVDEYVWFLASLTVLTRFQKSITYL